MAFAATTMTADTLVIDHAMVEGPYAVARPYVTDSLNMKGEAYASDDALKANLSLVLNQGGRHLKTVKVGQGSALPAMNDGQSALRVLRFTVQTDRFVNATLKVDHLSHRKVFVNRVENTDGKLQLAPGRTEVEILALSLPESHDSLSVSLVGDKLEGVTLNPTGDRIYTMADMMLGNSYRSVELSPSGKYLVTTSYFMKADGTAPYTTTLTELSTGREIIHLNEYAEIHWMPRQGDMAYFTRRGGNGRELVTFNPATMEEKVLAAGIPEGYVSLSPRADYFIFTKTEEGPRENNGLKRLYAPDDRQPGWRNRSSLWRYDMATGVTSRLTFGKQSAGLADISADGRQLLVMTYSFDAHKEPFDRVSILRMDAYTGRTDTLLADTVFVADAKFSPDATQLLVKASPASFGGVGLEVKPGQIPNGFDYRLYLYDIASRTTTPLLPNFAPSVEEYNWRADNGMVYFSAADGCDRRVFRLNPRTKQVLAYKLPLSYVQDYTIARSMKQPTMVFFGQTGERAREMFVTTLADKATPSARRIGPNRFEDMYPGLKVGKVTDWSFKASRGDSVRGFYILPPDFDASRKYPLIVYYYGGCTPTGKSLQFQYPLQVLAGQGYVIYVCEPSGAIGYGQEFAARHVNTWGQESGDDIIEGTKAFLAAHPFVDSKRVGCMGASYGGFMTQYLQTRTDIFAAAISHAGISNIASYWGGGYWGYTYGQTAQYGSYPWNNPDLYVKQSPLFNADKIHTPLLLLHGTADTNVPTNESQQLFTALKILGREVSYIQVEGENHVIVDYRKRLAWQNAIFAWFAKYLKNDATWWNTLYKD